MKMFIELYFVDTTGTQNIRMQEKSVLLFFFDFVLCVFLFQI